MSKTYIGVKVIEAWPEMRAPRTAADNPDGKLGYGVRYLPDGYVSWSPKAVFEEAYREVSEEDAAGILLAAREEIDRLANDGLFFDAITRDDDDRRARDLRLEAIHAAIKAGPDHMSQVLADADRIIAYVDPSADTIRAAEQRGYDAARPLDPDKIEIGDRA